MQPVPGLYPGPPLSPELPADLRTLPLESEPAPPSPADLTSYELMAHADVDQLSLEIEKERYIVLTFIQTVTFQTTYSVRLGSCNFGKLILTLLLQS